MASITFDESYTKDEYLSTIQEDFTRRAPDYDSGPNGAMHVDLIQSLLFYHPPSYPVLDIACGTGLLAAELGEQGEGVTGIDLTDSMLNQARMRSPKGAFVQGRAEHLPFPDCTFGSAYICAALVYFTDVDAALKEAHRVLREGGHVAYQAVTLDSYVIGVSTAQALRDVFGKERAEKIWKLPHDITDTREANIRLLERAGFVDVTMHKVTVLSDIEVRDVEDWYDRLGRNALAKPATRLPKDDAEKVRKRFVEIIETKRKADGNIQERVTSWYVKGVKPQSS